MSKPKRPAVHLHELTSGQNGDFFALLVERNRNITRDNKPFYSCRFKDDKRTVTLMVWSDSPWFEDCEQEWKDGQFYKIRGTFQEHKQYGLQIEINNIREVTEEDKKDGFDPRDFTDSSRFDAETMYAELLELAESHIKNEPLRKLTVTILDRHQEPLKHLPATEKRFYPFLGGLLEHTLSVTRNCIFLAEKYSQLYSELKPPLNTDLIVAGAMLHDIGRIPEMELEGVAVEPTVPGRLFGHLFLGRDLVRDTARELGDVNPELVQMLEHIVISHISLPEWGSPRLPLLPEVVILHHADDLDAKMEMYARCLTRDDSDGPFTARDPYLGRQLLKGRQV